MLRKWCTSRQFLPLLNNARFKSESSAIYALLRDMGKTMNTKGPEAEDLHAVQAGSSRYWDLENSRTQFLCTGGIVPINIKDDTKLSSMIDFNNEASNKLHIEIVKCPQLLAHKLISTFPKMELIATNLRIIKLSYHKYTDQNNGKLDCLIAANLLCRKLNEQGDFGFYSGAAIRNANNSIYHYIPKHAQLKTNNKEIHATVCSTNGYMHINNLSDNDIGVIYTDSIEVFSRKGLRKWIESVDKDFE